MLFNTDDGVKDLEETITQIEAAQKAGIETICMTPHYMEPDYINNKIQNKRKLDKIKIELEKRDIPVEVYLGNEVYISEGIDDFIKNNNVSTIANSDYVLIELPRNTELKNAKQIIADMRLKGKKIIIAHPERYLYVQKDIQYFDELINQGNVYLQGNYGSIIGLFGKETQKTIIKLIKRKKIHVLASDIHRNNIYKEMPKIVGKMKKIADSKYIYELTKEFPKKIINNEEIISMQKNDAKYIIKQFFKK